VTVSLRVRLFLAHALVIVAALAAMCAFAASQQRRWVIDRTRDSLDHTARYLAAELPREADWDALADSVGGALGLRVTLIDREGRVRGDSEVPRAELPGLENHAGRPEVKAALAGEAGSAARRSRTVNEELLYVAVPMRRPGAIAVVRLAEPLAMIRALNASLVRLSLIAALAALLISVPLLLWLTSRQASRVRALASIAAGFGAGDFAGRAPERPADELGRLGAAVNRMGGDLAARIANLARERDENAQILARMADGVALLDPAGHILLMNHSLSAMLDAPRPGHGAPFREIVRSPELDALITEATATRGTVERDVRLWAPRSRLVRVTATPLEREGRASLLLVLHDLTEIERANRVRQDFVANVSHELRTPLTSLRGYADTLLEGGLDDVEHRESFVRIIRDQTERLQALTEDLLSLAELERPGAELRLERFDLRELVTRQAAVPAERARRAGIVLEVEPGGAVDVVADRARIEQVVANLLDNAVKYTEKGGVRVALGVSDGTAWCEVRDSGSGIPAEDLPRIFERFYRVDKARSRELGGTGLGLSIVKHIVTLHGGTVSVESAPGRGSTFRFELPPAETPV
jgi:two-component system phosphate regulon sensor histidine kinase PhoR